jgi:hypothetical protein
MAMDNGNKPGSGMNPSQSGAQQNQSNENDRVPPVNEENPQEGDQWDNYRSRALSSEGGGKIEENDLLRADEAGKQKPEHRG